MADRYTGRYVQPNPGNDPVITTLFYFAFMLILVGGGVVGFRLRARQTQEAEKKQAEQAKQPSN